MNRLKEKRTARRQQNTRLINEARSVLDTADIGTLASLRERLQANNDELEKLNVLFEEHIKDEEFTAEMEAVLKYEDAAKGMLAQLKSRESMLQASQVSSVSMNPSHMRLGQRDELSPGSSLKLPTLKLQSFDGEICQWPSFWEQYQASVHANGCLTKGEKFQYLRTLLNGKAAAAIAGLQATSECYDDAVDILKRRFGDTRRIVQEHLARLRSLPSVQASDDVKGLRKLMDYVQCHMRGLKALNISSATYSTMLTDIILKALLIDGS